MTLSDVLVHVDTDASSAARIDLAVALAARHHAHLTGLHVMVRPTLPGFVEAEIPESVRELQRTHLYQTAARAESLFHERARRQEGPREWRAREADALAPSIMLDARYADLTVVAQGLDTDGGSADLARLPEELVLGVGRPVLIVPRYGTFPIVGERVLVAWNGSREATRAVNDALPILTQAESVTVLSVDPEGEPGHRLPGAEIALHLARHGVKAEAASTRSADIGVGDVLLSYAADLGADLLVMGAYGHSRLREMVLGGATRQILREMTVPVLMSH